MNLTIKLTGTKLGVQLLRLFEVFLQYFLSMLEISISYPLVSNFHEVDAYLKLTQFANLGGSLLSASLHARYAMGFSSPCS